MNAALGRYAHDVERRLEVLTAAGAVDRVWRRDVTFWGSDAARQASVANRLGWLDVAAELRGRAADLADFARGLGGENVRSAVLLGMGGSSLAPEVLRSAFGRRDGWPDLHVLDTTDPATIAAVERATDPRRTLYFVSSKSGTTLEPLSLFRYFHARVAAVDGAAAGRHFVAITDAGTPLQDLAREHAFRRVFTNPGDIGGRYSALSYFGMAPAAVAGIDVAALLDRGLAAARDARDVGGEALRLGATLGELARHGRNKATFLTTPSLAAFGLWVEQLIAESTGKLGRGILPVAGEPPAPPDVYGDDRVFVCLRLAADERASLDAAAAALADAGHPVLTIDLADLADLGREFFRWEFAIAVAGHVLEINPFDEPNVQESKDNTTRVLQGVGAAGALDAPGIDDLGPLAVVAAPGLAAGAAPRDALAALVAALAPGGYFAITAYLQQTAETDDLLAAVRTAVRAARRCATTLGYGPRFLHSTGQLHKGGPPGGVFLQITQTDDVDLAIPGAPYTFGQFKRAQAIGDLQSLQRHGRAVARLHLGRDARAGLEALRRAVESVTHANTGGA